MSRRHLLEASLLALIACGGRSNDPPDAGGGGHDAAAGADAVAGDAAVGADAAAGGDAGALECGDCEERVPVGLFHECTPPLEAYCPARTCTPGGDECGDGETCEDCAAAACCECAACVPACIRTATAGGPEGLPPLLKLMPSYGQGGQTTEVAVQGAPFYVGALGYTIRLGDTELQQVGGSTCSIRVRMPAEPAGTMLPVWVSQYGFGEPWVLAGFFSYEAPDDYPTCGQPGLPCPQGGECCATADVPTSCASGRCQPD